jgi:hypothetical protein
MERWMEVHDVMTLQEWQARKPTTEFPQPDRELWSLDLRELAERLGFWNLDGSNPCR